MLRRSMLADDGMGLMIRLTFRGFLSVEGVVPTCLNGGSIHVAIKVLQQAYTRKEK